MTPLHRLVVSAVLMVSLSVHTSAQPEPSGTLSLKERVRVASEIYSSVQLYFAHWRAVPDFDLKKAYDAYLDQILATEDRKSFDMASMEFFAMLRNGHTGFSDKWLQDTEGQQLGFYATTVEGKWVVLRSNLPELKPGDVIAEIDGQPFEEFFQGKKKYLSASDERWTRRALFESPYLFPQSFGVVLQDGRKVAVKRHGQFQWPGQGYSDIVATEKDGIGYIRIPSFSKPVFNRAAVKAVQSFRANKAIIIDVRSNHGGSTPVELTSKLMDRPYHWFTESTPATVGIFKYLGELGSHSELLWYGDVEQPDVDHYQGAVYILVDGGCFSACEDFVMPFKDNHRATILGERTAGSTGQPFSLDLGNGMGAGIGTKREFLPDGSKFEGVGVAPDIEVRTTIEDLRKGRDPVLEKAYELIP